MEDNIAIKVSSLDKIYRVGLKEEKAESLVQAITKTITAPVRNYRSLKKLSKNSDEVNQADKDIFYALRNVEFEIKKGETVGIIGKNGAGKSTLLKILSRITEPSRGQIEIFGKVASLLEVGTGFNLELTGRENIYLNGTILGMRKAEIDRKLDEIIDFSGVEKFIDTPVKRYSSGMKVRLAFSVAAHLEPEILVIDEVLAVGDAEFQRKCLGKMEDVAGHGRTVLFVSHHMAAVKTLCKRGIFLKNGTVTFDGDVSSAIELYQTALSDTSDANDGVFTMVNINDDKDIRNSQPFFISFRVNIPEDMTNPRVFCIINDGEGNIVVHKVWEFWDKDGYNRHMNMRVEFPALWLKDALYSVHFKLMGSTIASKGRFLSESYSMNVVAENDVVEAYGYLIQKIS